MFRAFLGWFRAEILFFRGKSENMMISRKKGRILMCLEEHFSYLHLKIGNLLQKLWKYHSFQGVKSLYSGNVGKFGKFGWGRIFTCQGIFGLFLQNIYPCFGLFLLKYLVKAYAITFFPFPKTINELNLTKKASYIKF